MTEPHLKGLLCHEEQCELFDVEHKFDSQTSVASHHAVTHGCSSMTRSSRFDGAK